MLGDDTCYAEKQSRLREIGDKGILKQTPNGNEEMICMNI